MPMKKRYSVLLGIAVVASLTWGVVYVNSLLPIITGYPAKYLCSAVFTSNRDQAEVESHDLNFSVIRHVVNDVDHHKKTVTSRFLWGSSVAVYRDGFGSTLMRDADEAALRNRTFPQGVKVSYNQDSVAWPLGNIVNDTSFGIDRSELADITTGLITGKKYHGNAYAFMVVHKGIPVAESYKPGFNSKTRFLGWSIAKSFTNAIAGIMVKEKMVDIHQQAKIQAWENDDRKRITINDLMQMQSGLRWNEDYGNRSDVTLMLYNSNDFAAFAYRKPLDFPVGSHWYYSSGSVNIICSLMRRQFNSDEAFYAFIIKNLFNKIGMPDAVLETDPSGIQVGSSYIYATARDYARFGLLYLEDGYFAGEPVLPAGWVSYTMTPAAHSNGCYGSLFWLNRGKYYPSAPVDMFYCNGHDGQRIFIIPSKKLVIVVLGYSPKPDNEMNFDLLIKDIVDATDNKQIAK
jgi:hypothetical protein